MPKTLSVILAICALCTAAFAQDAASEPANDRPAEGPGFVPTAEPAATPAPKPGVLQRIFGSRQGRRTLFPTTPAPKMGPATPAPATPKATADPRKKTKPVTAPQGTPDLKKKKTKPKPDAAVSAEPPADNTEPPAPATPAPVKKSRKGKPAPVVKAPDGTEPPADADPETKEKFRFDQAKARAGEDPEVQELKAKADAAVSDDEARSAQRAYNKALFGKMRKIDGSLEERINQIEAAILKRLDEK